jgi:diguanylate cyclase (GGDEF)-like protein/PAS domain S-box-containing protein
MQTLPRNSAVVAFAATAIGTGVLLGFAGWPQPHRALEFSGLILAAILTSALAMRHSTTEDWAAMPPSFVVDFTTLLLFGPNAAMLVATAGTVTQGLVDSPHSHPPRRMLQNAATVMIAMQAAGLAHQALGGTLGHFAWPWQGVPIAAAVVAYCLVKGVSAEVIVPLFARQPLNRSWPKDVVQGCPNYFIGASLAVGLVEVIDHRMWQVVPVAALPLYFAYRAYCVYLNRIEDEHRGREVIGSLDQGMSVVDSNGRVTLWNDALERIVGCPRERALGRSLVAALPVVGKTELPRAINEALKSRSPRTLAHLGLPCAAGERILEVKVLPVADGVTLLWNDVTARARAEQALRRSEERLALAAEGANDGLWEWDLGRQEFYFSGRWKAMIGLPGPAGVGREEWGVGRPEEWIDRVHADDIVQLQETLEAHLSGKTDLFLHEHRIRHEDGTYRRFLCRGVAVRGAGRRSARIAGSLTDTTERVMAQERLRSAGFLDPLTGLCNRTVFVEGLGRRLDEVKQRPGGGRFAALYLDLDRFKVVNDSLGHQVGDELLTAVSRRLESCLRQGDALARLGGDEFAILLNGLDDEQQANAIAFRIQEALSAPFSIGGREVFTSASIGIAFGLAQYINADEIMRDADTAMYHAKARGKARHELFDADMHARARDRLALENDLRHAVSSNDFEVHYQPIVFLATGMCVGFESLIRWTNNGKAISPGIFIPIAEELGLIEPIGTWVLQQACRTFADWQRRFPDGGLDCITVNVSSRQLMQQNFPFIVEQAVQNAGLKPCDLRLEITETALMDNANVAAEVLRELRDFGVKVYLDDFGTGYSSLSHLHKLPVDALKIDCSFVRSLLLPDRPPIVESILALARTLKTRVVAEGIESDVQARELERLGCTHAQGYLFSRPLPTRAVEEILMANQPLGPKKIQPSESVAAIAKDPGVYYSSAPFEWPEHLNVPRAAVQASTPRLTGEVSDLRRA